MKFNNATIKPRIYFKDGFWRVNSRPKSKIVKKLWRNAEVYVNKLNIDIMLETILYFDNRTVE